MGAYIFDIETDGLLDKATKIHCLVYTEVGKLEPITLTDKEEMIKFFTQDDLTLIGHFITNYDIPVAEKLLGISIKPKRVVDTLGISWYLNSSKDSSFKHGLEYYGEKYGVPKPPISDWENLTIEDYCHRCEEDTKINYLLWRDQQAQLKFLYEGSWQDVFRLLDYIHFKMDCMVEQNSNRCKLDLNLINYEIYRLGCIAKDRYSELLNVMPKLPIKKVKNEPKIMERADGSISSIGQKWQDFLKEQGLPEDTKGSVTYIDGYEEPNPDSQTQIKDWLFALGWNPTHIKYVRNKATGDVKGVPQVASERDKTDICDSVKELAERVPELNALAGYSTVKHRLALFEGLLRDMDSEGRICWDFGGFTNTFRLKHRKVVNLPSPHAPFAENVRQSFLADDGYVFVGADLTGVEDYCKQHYIYPYDPEYVESMRDPSFDPHLDIAVRANMLTEEQMQAHKDGIEDHSKPRKKAKVVNFSATYGVGANTLSTNMKVGLAEATKILKAYWDRNWSLKKFAEDQKVKTISGQMWVKQPVSGFWYTLRTQKDVFSTVNQGTAVYVFDTWVKYLRRMGVRLIGQTHDEFITQFDPKETNKEELKAKISEAMRLANEFLKLNVEIRFSIDFGRTYKDIH